jgi:ceramide glucosyltransferase
MQTALTVAAFVAGIAAALRYAVALPLLFRYLRRARVRAIPKGPTPPLSLLKPVYGAVPGLTENLVASLRQYYPALQVVFVHERPDDPALDSVAAARAMVPDVDAMVLCDRAEDAANPKAAVLIAAHARARHGLVVAADADVRPDPLWLRDVANGLAEGDAVSFVPVTFGARTFWARLVALTFNSEGLLGVIASRGRAVTGATIGVRREALEKIGGYRAVADRIADDYALGVVAEAIGMGKPVAMLPFVNEALANRTPFRRAVASLREEGVTVRYETHEPGAGDDRFADFPWADGLTVLTR